MARDYDYTFHFINGKYAKNYINGYPERTFDLKYEQLYSQEKIIEDLSREINAENLNKGVRINYNNKDFFSCHFSYDMNLYSDKKFNKKYTIIIPKKLVTSCIEVKNNVNKLTGLLNSVINVQIQNEEALKRRKMKIKRDKVKKFIGVVITATGIVGAMVALDTAYEGEKEFNEQRHQEYINDANERRRKNGLPPIDLVDENGQPYKSWDEFYSSVGKEEADEKDELNESLLNQAYANIERETQNQR